MTFEEVYTVAMLLDDYAPVRCSCCGGDGLKPGVLWGHRPCGQCRGSGCDLMGRRTQKATGAKIVGKGFDLYYKFPEEVKENV